MFKKLLFINLLICLITSIQVLWAYPLGLSSADLSKNPYGYLHWLCLCPVVIISVLLLIFKRFKISNLMQTFTITFLMMLYWLLINYNEFNMRVAGWSTFLADEIWTMTIDISLIPIGVCLTVFALTLHFILLKLKPQRND